MGLACKRIISFIMTVFILLSVIIVSFSKTGAVSNELGDFKGYNTRVIYNDNKIYFSAFKGKHLYIKELTSDNWEMNLEFEEKIIDFALNKGIVYTITGSTLVNNSYFLYKSDKPESPESFHFSMYSRPNMVVNNKGCIFLLNSKKSVCSLDMKGNIIADNILSANKIINCKGNTYAVSYDSVCRLSCYGVIAKYTYDKSYNIYNISENYFANDNGEIFEFKNNVNKIVDTENTLLPYCGETNKYLVSYQKNYLVGYDKSNGDLLVKYEINYTPYYLTAYKDKIYTITKSQSTYSYNVYSESDVFAENNLNDVSEIEYRLSFRDYLLNGKYIFVPQGTTKAVFKKNIVYDGYTISFNSNRRIIGTNEKVTFSGNKKNKTYTFIVLGDLTGEGNINTLDRKAMFEYLLGTKSLSKAFLVSSDLNKDDKITNIDLVKLERKRKDLL